MTEYTANRMFKEAAGISLRKYVLCKRKDLAKELLITTDMSVAGIAERVGFSSCSYFIRVFKQEEEITPYAYRQMKR